MANAVHYQCLTGIQTVIQGLALTGLSGATPLPNDRVYMRKLPTERQLTLPCVVVSLVPMPETLEGTLNNSDDYGYPCCVTIIAANNQDLTVEEPELKWREQIKQAFNNKRPAALQTAVSVPLLPCKWEPMAVLDLNLFKDANLFVSAAVVRVRTRELRP